MSKINRSGWLENGNFGIDDTVEFIGTKDLNAFIIKTNDIERTRVDSDGFTFMGGQNLSFTNNKHALKFEYFMLDIGTSQPDHAAIDVVPTFENTVTLGSIFGKIAGISSTPTLAPNSSLGAGTDTTTFRAGLFNANYSGNLQGRTISNVNAVTTQVSLNQNGTIDTAIGISAQAGIVLGDVTATINNAYSAQFAPPFKFLAAASTITNGITLRTIGGTSAGTNWNISAEGAVTPNRFAGKVIISTLTQTAPVFSLFVNGHQKITSNFGLFFGGTLDADARFVIVKDAASSDLRFGSAGNEVNNSRLFFDFETTQDLIVVTGVSSFGTPGIIWDLANTRINGSFGFGLAPTAVQTGYAGFANLSTDRTLDADSTTVDEMADVLGTLIEDLKDKGVIAA